MKTRLLILAGLLLAMAPIHASAAGRFAAVGRMGRVGHIGRFYGGGWYSPYWGGFWGPYWGSYWDPYWGPGVYSIPNTGQVKLDTKVKDAQVYIDGSYAGTTQENKSIHLRPGSYNIEIREAGKTRYGERVYVVAGKTLHLHPDL